MDFEELLDGLARAELLEYVLDRDARALNDGLAHHHLGI